MLKNKCFLRGLNFIEDTDVNMLCTVAIKKCEPKKQLGINIMSGNKILLHFFVASLYIAHDIMALLSRAIQLITIQLFNL
jgi:hypothetical protein